MNFTVTMKRRGKALLAAAVLLLTAGACVPAPTDASWAHMSLYNNGILLPFHDRVVLLDPLDGSPVELRDAEGTVRLDDQGNPRQWLINSPARCLPDCFYLPPVQLNDDTLLLTNYNRTLYEVDPLAARILPDSVTLDGHVVGEMLDGGDYIYAGLSEGDVLALNRDGLSTAWRFETDRGVWAQPLLDGNTLYIPSMNHILYAVNAQSGEEIWRVDLGGAIGTTPVLYDGYLYVGSFARKLFKISTDGSIAAEYSTKDWVWSEPTIVDDVLYAGDQAGNVYALNLSADGFTEVWQRQAATRAVRAMPLVDGDTVIVASRDRFVYWLNRTTGEEIVKREMRGEVLGEMLRIDPAEGLTLSEPLVIVTTMAREEAAVAFTLDNGERRWVYGF